MTGAYFDAMRDAAQRRLGGVAVTVVRSIFDADNFTWRGHNPRRAIVASQARQIRPGEDFAEALTRIICGTYTECGFPHDPAAVRQAVDRQLAAGPEPSPLDPRP
jgi:hypothetical protein